MPDDAPTPTAHAPAYPNTSRNRRAAVALWVMGALLAIAGAAALRSAGPVVIPVLFAVLITLLVVPTHKRLASMLPDRVSWLASVAVMLGLLVLVALFLGSLVLAAEHALQQMPSLDGDVQSLLPSGDEAGNILGGAVKDLWGTVSGALGGWLVDQVTGLARSIAGVTGVFVSTLVLVLFLVLLALSEREIWRSKVQSFSTAETQSKAVTAVQMIAYRLRKFLLIRTGIGALQAVLYVLWLWLFGVDLLIVWAVLTFILTYIPSLGSIIAGTLPVLYALATKDWTTALGVAAGLLTIEQIVGNFIDPKILGKYILLSPFVILVGVLFWGWLWGAAGAFLATPIMLSLVIICHQIKALRPIALFLSDQRSSEGLDSALTAREATTR